MTWSLGELSEQSPSGKQGWDQQPSAPGGDLLLEPECRSCLPESCLLSFAFPQQVPSPSLKSRCSYRALHHQTLLSTPRAFPKPVSRTRWLCMLETFPSLTPKLLLLLPEWPGSTQPWPSHTHMSHVPLSSLYALPEQHHPNLVLQQAVQLYVPSPPSHVLRMWPPTSPLPLPCNLQAQACVTLSCLFRDCRCFSLAL